MIQKRDVLDPQTGGAERLVEGKGQRTRGLIQRRVFVLGSRADFRRGKVGIERGAPAGDIEAGQADQRAVRDFDGIERFADIGRSDAEFEGIAIHHGDAVGGRSIDGEIARIDAGEQDLFGQGHAIAGRIAGQAGAGPGQAGCDLE